MKVTTVLLNLAKQFLFWFLFFCVGRLIFIFYNWTDIAKYSVFEFLQTFFYGYKLDQSITSYFLALPFFFVLLSSLFKTVLFNKINRYYTFFFVLLSSILLISELDLYTEWHQKLSYKAISYLARPSEVFHTASWKTMVFGFGFAFLLTFGFAKLYDRFIYIKKAIFIRNYVYSGLYFVFASFLIVLGIRGGLQPIPISQSQSFFSNKNYLNLVAMNSIWNLGHSVTKNRKYGNENPFKFHDEAEAKALIEQLHTVEKDTTVKLFTTDKPNVVLVMLESWTGPMVASLGGYKGITPKFEKLIEEGYFFTNFHATATLSHQGVVAIYGGFPTTPDVDIIQQPEKAAQLPKLISGFKDRGYHTSFTFGGQLIYGNIKSFILSSGFDDITEGENFEDKYEQGRLGVHDEGLFEKLITEQNKYKEPFFAGAFTASTHSPFDYPKRLPEIDFGGEYKSFINSVHYADSCVYQYIQEAKKQDWYDNTIFIFVADHSHPSPREYDHYKVPEYREIPFLIYGEPLKKEYRGKKNNRLASQYDIPATLLGQLGMEHKQFKWSNNIMNPYANEYVYYGFDDGLGFMTPDSNYFVYQAWEKDSPNKGYKNIHFDNKQKQDSIMKLGESYLQQLYQDYLDY